MKSQAYIEGLIASGAWAVRAVLNRPKNIAKEVFVRDIRKLENDASGEMNELHNEVCVVNIDYEKTMFEAADACADLFAIIAVCRDRLGMTAITKGDNTVKDIVVEYLKANGYDGLAGRGCGCGIGWIGECELFGDCRPAYLSNKNCTKCTAQCDAYDPDRHPNECYKTEKPEQPEDTAPEAETKPCARCGSWPACEDRDVVRCGPPAWECFTEDETGKPDEPPCRECEHSSYFTPGSNIMKEPCFTCVGEPGYPKFKRHVPKVEDKA